MTNENQVKASKPVVEYKAASRSIFSRSFADKMTGIFMATEALTFGYWLYNAVTTGDATPLAPLLAAGAARAGAAIWRSIANDHRLDEAKAAAPKAIPVAASLTQG